ncbi:MAG: hypothetical protein IT384_08370 [Deltaproteobacteria bacterium]|nr:hypothetical protein [Deltaproteobacteria bacterium]
MLALVRAAGGGATALVLLMVWCLPAARAQEPVPSEVDKVLATARNAFEYRDFAKVIELLDPWVHPPRIVDPGKLTAARELLGISLHVRGDRSRARAEFAEVLRADPEHRLDPFIVPPAVIETFEAVRTDLKPTLEQLLAARKEGTEPEADPPREALLPHPVLAYMPFGLSHFFALDAPEWGALWLGLEITGLATNIGAFWAARGLVASDGFTDSTDATARSTLHALQIGGLILFAASWIASGIQGHVLLNHREAELHPPASAPTPGPSGFLQIVPAVSGMSLRWGGADM